MEKIKSRFKAQNTGSGFRVTVKRQGFWSEIRYKFWTTLRLGRFLSYKKYFFLCTVEHVLQMSILINAINTQMMTGQNYSIKIMIFYISVVLHFRPDCNVSPNCIWAVAKIILTSHNLGNPYLTSWTLFWMFYIKTLLYLTL